MLKNKLFYGYLGVISELLVSIGVLIYALGILDLSSNYDSLKVIFFTLSFLLFTSSLISYFSISKEIKYSFIIHIIKAVLFVFTGVTTITGLLYITYTIILNNEKR